MAIVEAMAVDCVAVVGGGGCNVASEQGRREYMGYGVADFDDIVADADVAQNPVACSIPAQIRALHSGARLNTFPVLVVQRTR